MNKGVGYLLIGLLSVMAVACGKDETPSVELGYEYYPLEVGASLTYQVDSIVFNEFTETTDSFSFLLRETCLETFSDLEGRTAYRFERSVQVDDTSEFEFRRSFYVVTDGVRTEKVENNERKVVMVYPPIVDENWDANAFNPKDREDYVFEKVHVPYAWKSQSYDSTVRVILLNDTDNFIVKRFSEERYAKHVGLVEKRFYHIETQFEVDSGLLWLQRRID